MKLLKEVASFLLISASLNVLALGTWLAGLLFFFGADQLGMASGLVGYL